MPTIVEVHFQQDSKVVNVQCPRCEFQFLIVVSYWTAIVPCPWCDATLEVPAGG